MRELAILTFVTLDGVMQGPREIDDDPSGGFTGGGWALGCWDEVMAQVGLEAMAEPYDLLLGRKTYDSFSGAFRSLDAEVQNPMTAATKYVVTSDPGSLEWENSVPVTGDVADAVDKLKSEDGPPLQVHGSWQLIQTLLAHELVDEFRLWTFPVIIGDGKRLFSNPDTATNLSLRKTAAAGDSGAVMTIYRPVNQ